MHYVQKSARYSVETQPILINPIQEDEKNTSVLFRGPNWEKYALRCICFYLFQKWRWNFACL